MRCWHLLFLGLLAAPGCVGLDAWQKDKAPPEPAPAVVAPPRPRLLVNPGDVTERNAREMLNALRDELDRDESEQRPTTTATSSPRKKD